MGNRRLRWTVLALLLAACGCGSTTDELVTPWCKYRVVRSPGGSGIWSGSSHTEVLVRRWWGWSRVLDGMAAPGHPIVLTPAAVLVPIPGTARVLRKDDLEMPLACGDAKASVTVPRHGDFIDCVDHLAGPAAAIATSLRVRRVNSHGTLLAQQEFSAGDPGRVFLSPSISFYDDTGRPYLVTFWDPWAETTPDGEHRSKTATPEDMAQIACEIMAVGETPTSATPAPPGHKIADCSSEDVWSRAIGRRLHDPWKF